MTLRPAPGSARRVVVALDYEIAQEQASALGRMGRALEAALAALAAYDGVAPYDQGAGGPTSDHPESRKTRARLVQEAGHALWCFIVQRESCGLRDLRPVIRGYRVPAEVQNRMGIVIAPQIRRRPAPWP
ncbi:MAG: hypothetical protein WBD90_08660 [Xanthobacteraceae bacterium]